MALAYSREFLFNRLRMGASEEQSSQLPSDLSNLVNYAGSIQSNDEANSIATSLSDSSNSPSSSAPITKIAFEIGHSDDEDISTDAPSPRRTLDIPPEIEITGTESDSVPLGPRFLADDDDSDLEEQLLMVAAGQSPITSPDMVPRKLSFYEQQELDFTRRQPGEPQVQKSLLSSAITSIGNGDPLNQFISTAATAESSLSLGIYFQFGESPATPIAISVRGMATVHQVIGYSLKIYRDSFPLDPLESINPNQYNLRLHDEDGEPDDDFPALERKRQIDLYSVDEVVIVKATKAEFEANSRETPFETSKPVGIDSQDDKDNEIIVRAYMFPFDNVLSQVYWSHVLPVTATIATVFQTICKEKRLDIDDYIVRSINTQNVENTDTSIGALNPPQMALHESNANSDEPAAVLILEIVPKRAIDGDESIRSPTKRKGAANKPSSSYAPAPIPNVVGLNFQQFGYYKYRVWRRQHVSFLGRQERELAIDGEYVYIIPPSDRYLLEQPKTTTFHVRQVIRCKQSSKVAVYLKITVMKQTGPKRYDIDCQTEADCVEIVQRLNRLMRNAWHHRDQALPIA